MKHISGSALFLLLVIQLGAGTTWADDIREVDYPIRYEVLSTSKTDKLVIRKTCSMTLRDQANMNVTIGVSRTRLGACSVLTEGMVYNGRQNEEKNVIEIVIPVGEDRAKVENWHIDSTVSNPQ
jgi:hypothetical protein